MARQESKSLGALLQNARRAAGLTQYELAEKIGMARGSIVDWETNRQKIPPARVAVLKKVLGDFARKRGLTSDADEVPAFGAWLRKVRSSKDISIPRLAEKSGVSIPAIYNIETGKSLNPQKETRKKLENALGQDAPSDVTEEAEDTQRIEGLGALTDFDPYDDADLPKLSGVYVFYDGTGRPTYIGQSKRIDLRIKQSHRDKFWFKQPIVERAAYLQIPDKTLRGQVEAILIRFLGSQVLVNKNLVDRSLQQERE